LRGVYDPKFPLNQQPLPSYDYRDHGIPMWDVIHTYANGILKTFYADDHAVATDKEIQHWGKEIAVAGKMRGFPTSISTIDQLTDIVTSIIFTCSAQHAAVNFIQYDMLAWIPNMPLTLQIVEYPTTKNQITMQYIFGILPNNMRSAGTVSAVKVLSQLPRFGWQTLMHPIKWKNSQAQDVTNQYVAALQKISSEVESKNAGRTPLTNYWVLDPKNIPLSIGI